MKVLTLKAHGNCHGEQYEKGVGDAYEHPNPKADLTLGNVEDAGDNQTARDAGASRKAVPNKGRNGKKQNAKGSKAGG